MIRTLLILLAGLILLALACHEESQPAPVPLTISPDSVTVYFGESYQFTASESGVAWTVNGILGGDSLVGTITATGLYRAPSSLAAGRVTIGAIKGNRQVEVTILLMARPPDTVAFNRIAVSLKPDSVTLALDAAVQCSVRVTGTSDQRVLWYVDGILNGNSCSGTVTSRGYYTAPHDYSCGGRHVIRAVSVANPAKADSMIVWPPLTIALTPRDTTILYGQTAQYSAQIMGGVGFTVSWSVDGIPGGNSTTGRISASGLYTAPEMGITDARHRIIAEVTGISQVRDSSSVVLKNLYILHFGDDYGHPSYDLRYNPTTRRLYHLGATPESLYWLYSDTLVIWEIVNGVEYSNVYLNSRSYPPAESEFTINGAQYSCETYLCWAECWSSHQCPPIPPYTCEYGSCDIWSSVTIEPIHGIPVEFRQSWTQNGEYYWTGGSWGLCGCGEDFRWKLLSVDW